MPRNWNHQLWLTETNVTRPVLGQKARSDNLVAVDAALRTYDSASSFNKARALDRVFDAYETWKASKNDPTSSIRNKGGTLLNDFEAWLREQDARLMPAPEVAWEGTPNCYAYSMKCRQVVGNAPTPGAAAGRAVLPGDERWREAQQKIRYHASLLQGIVADARACNKTVEILSGPEEGEYPTPHDLPVDRANANQYIAAMIAKSDGFHFMRRDSATGLWSHKNGGGNAEVETSATLLAKPGKTLTRETKITDAVAIELLECTNGKYIGFAGFKFVGYVLVPREGITVKGAF